MKLIKREASIYHDYYKVVTSVYPKIIDSIDSIFLSFKENRDASKHFVDYFRYRLPSIIKLDTFFNAGNS